MEDLYMTGEFVYLPTTTPNMAKWNGSAWEPEEEVADIRWDNSSSLYGSRDFSYLYTKWVCVPAPAPSPFVWSFADMIANWLERE